jgi:hypothetical protein
MDNDKIADVLKNLVMENDRVSLPCLGSFLSQYTPACVVGDLVYPPSKSIVFHQNEIWNDEKLEHSLARLKKVSIGVAKEELAFWIDNICVLLATGENVVLPGLGKLYVSEQAKLIFEQINENLLPESFGLTPAYLGDPASPDNTADEDYFQSDDFESSSDSLLTVGLVFLALLGLAGLAAVMWVIYNGNF